MRVQYRTSDSSVDVSSVSSSSDDSSSDGDYAEGRDVTPAHTTQTTASEQAAQPQECCPAPVRAIIGVFCALTAVAGGALLIVGGNALNDPSDSQGELHRAMAGIGATMLAVGSACSSVMFARLNHGETQPA